MDRPRLSHRPHALLAVGAVLFATSCTTVLGTSDLEPCETGQCGGGGAVQGGGGAGGGGGASSVGGQTSVGGAANTGGGGGQPICWEVTVTVPAGVMVRLDTTPMETEFVEGSTPKCASPGVHRLRAYCGDGGGNKAVVDWGSASGYCATPTDECNFNLSKPEVFNVTGAVCQ